MLGKSTVTLNGSWSFSGLIQTMGAEKELVTLGNTLRSSVPTQNEDKDEKAHQVRSFNIGRRREGIRHMHELRANEGAEYDPDCLSAPEHLNTWTMVSTFPD
jgi:hypothetical protein